MLYPIFDRLFIFDSYSCRIGKGTHRALRRLQSFLKTASRNNRRAVFALKCDIRRFFDSIDHSVLASLICRKVSDPDTLGLISCILYSFHKTPNIGLPLGNVTSQLFANIYLNELDRFVKHELRIPFYLRYCDDFLLLDTDPAHLRVAMVPIATFLNQHLRLTLHPDKISLRAYRQGIDFVGYVVRPHCTTLRTKTKRWMLQRIIPKNRASYTGMLKHCDGYVLEGLLKRALAGR
jgi:RNA-directed DNA polymerase